MALEKNVTVDRIEVVGNFKHVQIRRSVKVVENGTVISETFDRECIAPGMDYSSQPDDVRAVCDAVHTPEILSAYQEFTAQQELTATQGV